MRLFICVALVSLGLALQGCSGSSGDSSSSSSAGSIATGVSSSAGSGNSSSAASSNGNSSSAASSSAGSSSSAASSSAGSTSSGVAKAKQLALALGKPAQLLIGLGGEGNTTSLISQQGLQIDIYNRYLVGVGAGAWPSWNANGSYVDSIVGGAATTFNAVPMYTLYQMAANGDGNLSLINDATFMTTYWAQVKLMYQRIAVYNKPALVQFEPDFWGYVQRQAPSGNPAQMPAYVSGNVDCANLANNVVGIAGCLVKMARQYAPKAYVGFMPSRWGGDSTAQVVQFMNALGAAAADFIVVETQDRDAGCFEVVPQPSYCVRSGSGWYWTQTNFDAHFIMAQAFHDGIGGLPLIWWQVPMGVPSSTPGGTQYSYRDNRVDYFLKHPSALVNVGGVAVVFGGGEAHQTHIGSDNGQFNMLLAAYRSSPTLLP